jgi:hypothetical protein
MAFNGKRLGIQEGADEIRRRTAESQMATAPNQSLTSPLSYYSFEDRGPVPFRDPDAPEHPPWVDIEANGRRSP